MPRIYGLSAAITADLTARLLQPLLVRVMAGPTERLPVLPIPEQILISPVRDDVVNDSGRLDEPLALTPGTQRMTAQEAFARPLPAVAVKAGSLGWGCHCPGSPLTGGTSLTPRRFANHRSYRPMATSAPAI